MTRFCLTDQTRTRAWPETNLSRKPCHVARFSGRIQSGREPTSLMRRVPAGSPQRCGRVENRARWRGFPAAPWLGPSAVGLVGGAEAAEIAVVVGAGPSPLDLLRA
jgi:hypothetical protein